MRWRSLQARNALPCVVSSFELCHFFCETVEYVEALAGVNTGFVSLLPESSGAVVVRGSQICAPSLSWNER